MLQWMTGVVEIPGLMAERRVTRMSERASRAEGALLAAAAGDALGWPVEPRGSRVGGTRDIEPQLKFVAWERREGGRFAPFVRHVPAGTYSDDTQLLLAVGRSLLRGENWWKHLTQCELPIWTLYELGGGGAVRRAAKLWERGMSPWAETVKAADRRRYFDAGGNGVVMRVLPHAIYAISEESFEAAARRIVADGAATHGHPRALVGALAAGYALWRALRWEGKVHYGELIDETLVAHADWSRLPDIDGLAHGWRASADDVLDVDYIHVWERTVEEMLGLLYSSQGALARGSLARDSEVLRELGAYDRDGSAGTRTAAIAAYLASRYVAQPPAGLLAAAFARNTDADTIATLTGSILGAVAGGDWLKPLIPDLQDASYVRSLAGVLAQGETAPQALDGPAVGVRRRVHRLLEKAEAGQDLGLPIFGRSRLLRVEEHPTKSSNDIRTWWLATELQQTLAVTRIRKLRDAEPHPTPDELPQPNVADDVGPPAMELCWVALLVRDLPRSVSFYRDLLRLRVARSSDAYVRFGQNLILQQADLHDLGAFRSGPDSGSFASVDLVTIVLEPRDFDCRYRELQDARLPLSNVLERGNGRRFRLHDPDGHVVEVRSQAPQSD